jgi:mRNA interferase HigB
MLLGMAQGKETGVRAISQKRLRVFWTRHPAAEPKLRAWYRVVKRARWQSFADVRRVYPSVDRVGQGYVFDIQANTAFRLIAVISPDWTVLLICMVIDHKEYDRGRWKKTCRCDH